MERLHLITLLLTCALVSGEGELRWQNNYDEPLFFNCPTRQSISSIKSMHDNDREDRLWDFECKDSFIQEPDCFWSNYANDFDQEFTYTCPKNSLIAGMSSFHDNHHEDRRWKFYCCRVNNYCYSVCQWTPYVNNFDELFHWFVPTENYLVGAESYHVNKHEDRRWKYQYCTRRPC